MKKIKKPMTVDEAWAMKREGQAQWRELVSSGKMPLDAGLLLRGDRVRNAKIIWPDAPLSRAAARRAARRIK